jgi:two-component system C4-dicarboxylate transport sensor histidine kinase DctB
LSKARSEKRNFAQSADIVGEGRRALVKYVWKSAQNLLWIAKFRTDAAMTLPPFAWPGTALFRALAVGVILLGMGLAATFAHRAARERLLAEAAFSADARVQVLQSTLAQQRAVVAILADDDRVRAALSRGGLAGHEAVSAKLERLRAETRGTVIYLLDAQGTAIAASNWDLPDSFVGANYAFRSYFTQALRHGTALQYALGTVSHRPGLYLSHAVGQAGVVVVKVEFDALERAWAQSPDQAWVSDASGAVLLSSVPEARFGPLPDPGPGRLLVRRAAGVPGWTLTLAVPGSAAWQAALAAGGSLGTALFLLAFGLDRLRRARAEALRRAADLEAAVAERTRDLQDEMAERRRAEQRLAGMQADLVQANKLATLGQVTAGLAHEVNQPLATIRLLAENALALMPKRGPKDVVDNLATIVRMSERIGQITTELRGFARKATGELRPVDLREVLEASVLLTASRRRAEGAHLHLPEIPPGTLVRVEAVRLEQVLVNLIQNAQEALTGQKGGAITLAFEARPEAFLLTVADNGPGLPPEIEAQLLTPFATSKPGGLGLGLVIAQDILRDFGGDLTYLPGAPGAAFQIRLPR